MAVSTTELAGNKVLEATASLALIKPDDIFVKKSEF
jgi:hypothetical protein